ncbi:hypothetical protein FisN_32Lh003 [Fistulifera solaris]|uniref:Uncharacterized protein n=1 Tax=Fistulifera solaris TaxID=1519565 RepID=A0A1Z5KNR8_FISSO|nr:hypothetical protein FisN_32Lh003 [Fistulifera solaris]|eukprot:GAX27980.1 hypothetical protein FisN_32Lh003 [Fistulifera solaris]
MTSRTIKSPGCVTTPFFESSQALVKNHPVERFSPQPEGPENKNRRSFQFQLRKTFSFVAKRDNSSTELAPEERDIDRRNWLMIEREKARKELRLDQEGDTSETTAASELLDLTPKRVAPMRASSYSPSLTLPVSPLDSSPRRRDGKHRRGRRSQLRETVTEETATKDDDKGISSPSRKERGHSGVNRSELSCTKSDCSKKDEAELPPRRPRNRSVGPRHREKKDDTDSNHVESENPSQRPRRRSLGPSKRQLRTPDLANEDTPGLDKNHTKDQERPSRVEATNLSEDGDPTSPPRRGRHLSSRNSRRNLFELSDEDDGKHGSPQSSPRRRLQTRKVKRDL